MSHGAVDRQDCASLVGYGRGTVSTKVLARRLLHRHTYLNAAIAAVSFLISSSATVLAAEDDPYSLAKYPNAVFVSDYTGWSAAASAIADYDSTDLSVYKGYGGPMIPTRITVVTTQRADFSEAWTITRSAGTYCAKLRPPKDMLSGGSSLTGSCNRTDMKITAADIFMNTLVMPGSHQYSRSPAPLWFQNYMYRHELAHALGFVHPQSCATQRAMNPLGCWFDWQLSDVLTSADLDRVNTWY